MTAEIAIVNHTGVALAADSAVTIGRQRVWKNSNKLFHLSPMSDVGLMIFGNSTHCGLPWEVVIKQYRRKLGRRSFAKLADYVSDFLDFLDNIYGPHDLQRDMNMLSLMVDVRDEAIAVSKDTAGALARRQRFLACLGEIREEAETQPEVFDSLTRQEFDAQFAKFLDDALDEQDQLHVTLNMRKALKETCFEVARRSVPSGVETGVVFAGFGQEELLPVVHQLFVDGRVNDNVRAWTAKENDLNLRPTNGAIMPFAQSDITHLFIEGLLPDYIDFVSETLRTTLDRKSQELIEDYVGSADRDVEKAKQSISNTALADTFRDEFKSFRRKAFVQPMMKVVSSLPKEEMAAMAEALVETTSLRRKIDSPLETVGGPVDVAIISKSDGFVWIKRKHYFDIELNRDFVQRRDERYSGDES